VIIWGIRSPSAASVAGKCSPDIWEALEIGTTREKLSGFRDKHKLQPTPNEALRRNRHFKKSERILKWKDGERHTFSKRGQGPFGLLE
jgi:hypothetical protein